MPYRAMTNIISFIQSVIVIVFLAHKASRVLAEGTDFVLKGQRVANQLGFIENIIDILHNLIAHLYPDADIYRSRLMGWEAFLKL